MTKQKSDKTRDELESEWFRVEVSDRNGQIVSIEPGMLSGREIGEKEEVAILKAIRHLRGFIGTSLVCPACGPTDLPCEHVPTAQDFL